MAESKSQLATYFPGGRSSEGYLQSPGLDGLTADLRSDAPDASLAAILSVSTQPTSQGNSSTIDESRDKEQISKANSGVGFSGQWLNSSSETSEHILQLLMEGEPTDVLEYSEHLFKLYSLVFDGNIEESNMREIELKLDSLMNMLPKFTAQEQGQDPSLSRLYIVVERCFDVIINIVTNLKMVTIATLCVRFLTTLMMSLNYWELYNLLQWRPAIYQFLVLIKLDLSESYRRLLRDYKYFKLSGKPLSDENVKLAIEERIAKEKFIACQFRGVNSPDTDDVLGYSFEPDDFDEHDKFVFDHLTVGKLVPRKRGYVDHKLTAHKVVKKQDLASREFQYGRSSNYDPDVVHECQLPSADEPGGLCLRRFARKYELIRHQETVHSKRKKLFKCFVCLKQNPYLGPRIFTRHDTLAKHIRVNHRISGKEAKAEVAYSKKHAEIVDESAIPMGRKKIKGEYEFLIVLDRKPLESGDGIVDDEMEESSGLYNHSNDEVEVDVI